jgi:hypothetical protein
MSFVPHVLNIVCSTAAAVTLAQAFWVFLARDVHPNIQNLSMGSLLRSRFEELDAMPPQELAGPLGELQVLRELRVLTPPDAHFITFYQRGFAYYANRHFISDLDPRLVDFYRASDKKNGFAFLRRLGINYVYLPGWSWPTIDKSEIKNIIDDPTLATRILDRFGYKAYRLNAD